MYHHWHAYLVVVVADSDYTTPDEHTTQTPEDSTTEEDRSTVSVTTEPVSSSTRQANIIAIVMATVITALLGAILFAAVQIFICKSYKKLQLPEIEIETLSRDKDDDGSWGEWEEVCKGGPGGEMNKDGGEPEVNLGQGVVCEED